LSKKSPEQIVKVLNSFDLMCKPSRGPLEWFDVKKLMQIP
jgi:hypothetical protein